MNNEYIQNLRYKLQKRVRRLNSTEHKFFHFSLIQFWGFLEKYPIFQGILDDLVKRWPDSQNEALLIVDKNQPRACSNEDQNAAMTYRVLERCINSQNQQIEVQIGRCFNQAGTKYDEVLATFKDLILEPFYEYLDEQLDDQKAVLALLIRYKHKCEWFARDQLYAQWVSDTQLGERGLAKHLYEYLHDQGLDFSIEPKSASGEVDLIGDQKTDDPIIADAKIFDPEHSKGASYITKGFAQLYRYMVDFNEPFGYLVIYQTSEWDLRFTLSEKAITVPFVTHNNKTIFLLTVDIFPHQKSASKRGALDPVEITESGLLGDINQDKVSPTTPS